LKKLEHLRSLYINPYPYRFDRTHTFLEIKDKFEELTDSQQVVSICGRIITIRKHGRTTFATLIDENANLQIYLRKEDLKEKYDLLEDFDIGDYIGVKGKVFKTKTGEITILVDNFEILAKSLRPLPEKWHGLKDIEIRYRKRYLDLIANPEVKEIFKQRTRVIKLIRQFFDGQGFIEMETPILQTIYGGAAARPFTTFFNALDQQMYLRIADELYLKRLIVGGFDKVYEIGKDFRNEGIDRLHNPEFTQIEAYQAYTDYEGIMNLVEALLEFLVQNIKNEPRLELHGESVPFTRPFNRLKYVDALNKKIGFDILNAPLEKVNKECQALGINLENLSIGLKIDKLFSELIQKELKEPTFVVDYPKLTSPLAKQHRENANVVERFELVVFGLEIVNAFSELNDPIEQRKRFEMQLQQKEEGIAEIDEDFLEALEYGMPPTGGLGIGIDRLCMILLNQPSIRDIILFPQLKKEQ